MFRRNTAPQRITYMLALCARNLQTNACAEVPNPAEQPVKSWMTEEQAMWRVKMEDDHVAFAWLVERWEGPIKNLCARMTGDIHRGEDLTQETFARVFANRKNFRPQAKFSTWLWRIALNLCYDELRKRQRRGESELSNDQEAVSEEPAPDASAASGEERELVRSALLRLPEVQRAALVFRFCEGLKLREIAEILQIPETTVASRVAAGLTQITCILEPKLGKKLPGNS